MFGFNKKRIYLDYAAATPVRLEVLKAMEPFWFDNFGNPASIHLEGERAKKSLKEIRHKVASLLGAKAEEIIFTSGGTESNNLAVLGYFRSLEERGKKPEDCHALILEIEHSSVLRPIERLKKKGLKVDYIKISEDGEVNLTSIKDNLKENTVFVSVMAVNNEIGKKYPLNEIAKILSHYSKKTGYQKPVLHSDASQAFLYSEIDLNKLHVDLLTIDGSKIYGPKGSGLLYKKKDIHLGPLLEGGDQEFSLRAGTQNLPAIAGLAEAMNLATSERESETERLRKIRDEFAEKVIKRFPEVKLNGSLKDREVNNVNIFIPDMESEFAVIKLDGLGFAVSSSSACLLEKGEISYVVEAIRDKSQITGSSVRISLGRGTTGSDLDKFLDALAHLLKSRF